MRVLLPIGVSVMMAVMSGPPQHAFLNRGAAEPGQRKLEHTAGLEAAMRKIAMEARGDAEHPDKVRQQACGESRPADPRPESQQRGCMDQEERNTRPDIQTAKVPDRRGGVHRGSGNSRTM